MGNLDLYSSSYLGNTVPEYQLANQWILQFEDFPELDFHVQETNLPLFSIETERIFSDLVVPTGKGDYSTYSITFNETSDFKGFQFHKDWLDLLYDFEKRVVKRTFHSSKKSAVIKFISGYNLLAPGKAQLATVTNGFQADVEKKKKQYVIYSNISFKLEGIQLVSIDDLSLDNDTGEPLSITVQYEIQKVTPSYTVEKILER